jgi:hypothetical protein
MPYGRLSIMVTTTDSQERDREATVVHGIAVPPVAFSGRDWRRWLLFQILRGEPHGSDRHVEQRLGSVLVWVHAPVERQAIYRDLDEARAAAERLAESRR